MTSLPTKDDLRAQAVAGEDITEDVVNKLAEAETPEGGNLPPRGSTAAMAQSLHDMQEHFKAVASEITSKPEEELTKEDASHLMSAESRAKAGIRPPKDTVSAHVQSVVDKKQQDGVQGNQA